MSQKNNSEILLSEEEKRYVIFPIKHEPFWNMYKKAQANMDRRRIRFNKRY